MSDLAKQLRFTAEIAPPAEKFTSLVPGGRELLIEAATRIEELESGLEPFADFGDNVDETGWTSNIHREPISTWFGPSDFRTARNLLGDENDGT